jgi:hypothetical protein
MTQDPTASVPKMYFGPFNNPEPLGIDRGYYMAVYADDPAAAAKFATENTSSSSMKCIASCDKGSSPASCADTAIPSSV